MNGTGVGVNPGSTTPRFTGAARRATLRELVSSATRLLVACLVRYVPTTAPLSVRCFRLIVSVTHGRSFFLLDMYCQVPLPL